MSEAYPVPVRRPAAGSTPPSDEKKKQQKQSMPRTNSFEMMASLAKGQILGPTQRAVLEEHPDAIPLPAQPPSRDPEQRSLLRLVLLCAALLGVASTAIVLLSETTVAELPALIAEVAAFQRVPATAQDNTAAVMAIVLSLIPLIVVDYTVCAAFCRDAGARWFLLHAIGNIVVAALCVPDFFNTFANPPEAMAVAYCQTLPFPGCSDWPTCIIIAMHIYHMLSFKLSADDMFHHLLFVPVIGGMNFAYPNGTLGNVLSFFISGLPGGISYFLLAAVKSGALSSMHEKRLNCSINTWIRGPGITAFCTLTLASWAHPAPSVPPSDMMPWYVFFPSMLVSFFNGQYYAQRVIGNYYIRKAQDHAKRGIKRVDLHAS